MENTIFECLKVIQKEVEDSSTFEKVYFTYAYNSYLPYLFGDIECLDISYLDKASEIMINYGFIMGRISKYRKDGVEVTVFCHIGYVNDILNAFRQQGLKELLTK